MAHFIGPMLKESNVQNSGNATELDGRPRADDRCENQYIQRMKPDPLGSHYYLPSQILLAQF